jgi:DNA-binding PadR family transcriptional regulator
MIICDQEGSDSMTKFLPLTPSQFFVLFALAEGEKHGYRIMHDVRALSGGTLRMGPATLYTTIQKLSDERFIEEISGKTGDRRRIYRLSSSGKRLLESEFSRQHEVLLLAKRKRIFNFGGRA